LKTTSPDSDKLFPAKSHLRKIPICPAAMGSCASKTPSTPTRLFWTPVVKKISSELSLTQKNQPTKGKLSTTFSSKTCPKMLLKMKSEHSSAFMVPFRPSTKVQAPRTPSNPTSLSASVHLMLRIESTVLVVLSLPSLNSTAKTTGVKSCMSAKPLARKAAKKSSSTKPSSTSLPRSDATCT